MEKQIKTIESEINSFANELPYWGKFLSQKILSSIAISETDVNEAYSYLLEDLGLKDKSDRPEIVLTIGTTLLNNYKPDLLLKSLTNVEGVNALSENQSIEFSPNLTIIYGDNGSGKSGYTRLLKRAFYSKAPEEIVPNVYKVDGSKSVSAKFSFSDAVAIYPYEYPTNGKNVEFSQFAVFDGKSILKHLENKNQFEFRPSGLNFFSAYTDCIKRLETKLNNDIARKNTVNNFSELFEGISEIKTLVDSLSAKTDVNNLKKYIPFSDDDNKKKREVQKKYDDLLLAVRNKEKEISNSQKIKQNVENNKQLIVNLNRFFTDEHISLSHKAIEDYINKEKIAQKEGVDNFAVESVENIGSVEWKSFINAANTFASQQPEGYPSENDICILCHQPLSENAKTLITSYWTFIKSVAEKEAKVAQTAIEKGVAAFEKLNFDIFPDEGSLTVWLSEFYPESLERLSKQVLNLSDVCKLVIAELKTKVINKEVVPLQIDLAEHDRLIVIIDERIKTLSENKENKEFEELKLQLNFLVHKEKFSLHIDKVEKFIDEQKWVAKANKVSWAKRAITDAEKNLSAKYFNQNYIDKFNDECKRLNGSFGIVINHTGASGTSYRQLFIQGKNPAAILSDGEQNVIAISDFITEMNMSEVNRGIVFDDPVTSLDHMRRETIARRLVEEAGNKQVVVFTHDVVFLLSLKYFSTTLNIPNISLSLYKSGDVVGLTKPSLPWIAANVSDRLSYLNSELQRITKLSKTADPDTYRIEVKSWCEQLRESWERCVEERLFKGVVTRFSPGIQTQKLKKVIVTTELIDEITEGMTNTSNWIHDQGAGMNSPTPTPEDLARWISDFSTFIKVKCKVE